MLNYKKNYCRRCVPYEHRRSLICLQRIYNFLLLHATLSTVLDYIGFYFPLLYYFWDYLLTGGLAQIAVSCLFQCFAEKEYQTKSKRNETFGNVIFSTNVIQETWSGRQETIEEAMRQRGAPTPWARPPPSWAPRCSTDLLLPPI